MKKKISNLILLTVFLCTALLGFSACGTVNNITERLDALEAKVAALEAANTNFQQKLAALDTSSASFEDDLAELTSAYNELYSQVANAADIERKVLDKTSIGTDSVIEDVAISLFPASDGETFSIGMTINYNVPTFPFHLAV